MASGIILCTRVIPHILFDPKYYDAWRYIPLLVIAMVFTCIVNFLGSIYMVEKKSVRSLVTAAVSAVINVLLNLWWIPVYGVNGAAAATLICYLTVFVIRLVDTRRYIRIRWDWPRFVACSLIVLAQTVIALLQLPLWWVWEILLCMLTVLLCGKSVLATASHLLKRGN